MSRVPAELRNRIDVVARVLRDEWDPIGLGQMPDLPADEYESYAPVVVGMIEHGATDMEIAIHLMGLERDEIGLPPRSPEELIDVARALRTATQR
jgi:hypothetical protein